MYHPESKLYRVHVRLADGSDDYVYRRTQAGPDEAKRLALLDFTNGATALDVRETKV